MNHKVKNIKILQSPKNLQPKYIQILNITTIDSLWRHNTLPPEWIITIESWWVLYWPSVPWCVCDIIVPPSSVQTRYQAWCQVAPNISQVVPRRYTLLCCNGSGIGCKSRGSITLDFEKANIWISYSTIDKKSEFSF